MFQSIAEKFVKTIGEDEYQPCSSVMAAENLKPLGVVERKASKWWFGKDQYYPTEFTLSDLTKPAVSQSNVQINPNRKFAEFSRTSSLDINGKLEAHFKTMFGSELDNCDKVSINAPVGEINLVEVNQPSLLTAINTSRLNMTHELVREMTMKPRRALCIVVGILSAASDCKLTASLQLSVKADIKGNVVVGGGEVSEDVNDGRKRELQIPAGLALAYQVMELAVDKNGSMKLKLSHDARGGFTHSVFVDRVDGDYQPPPGYELAPKELFTSFSTLSADSKRGLVEDLKAVCTDQALLTELYRSLKPHKSDNKHVQRCLDVATAQSVKFSMLALVRAFLDLTPYAQHQVMGFPTDSASLDQMIGILSKTYSGEPLTVEKPLPEFISNVLTEGLDYTVKGADGQIELQTECGVYSSDARSTYVALCGMHILYQE